MIKNTAILVCTYDGAEDLWSPIAETYQKYWPDCPYNIYLATNHKYPSLPPFKPLSIGDETSWSDNVLKCLEKISEDYVLLTYDDLFLYKKINTAVISNMINTAMENNWNYLRFHPSPKYDQFISNEYGAINTKRAYRASTVFALFKKSVLIDLLDRGETAWEFEKIGSIRSNKYDNFYVVTHQLIPYLNGVVKGKWVPDILAKLEKDKINIGDTERAIMSKNEAFVEKFNKLRFQLLLKIIPPSLRYKMSNFKNKIK
jgi:hypothetical protein